MPDLSRLQSPKALLRVLTERFPRLGPGVPVQRVADVYWNCSARQVRQVAIRQPKEIVPTRNMPSCLLLLAGIVAS